MPRIELDIDDAGEIVGQVPVELEAIHKRMEAAAHGVGYGKGAQQAAADAKKQIEDAIKAETAKLEALAPLEKERMKNLETETKELNARISDTIRENSKAMKAREETHARELLDRADALKKRNARIELLTKAQLRAYALENGARDESLSELEIILSGYVGFNDDMDPFVKDLEGNPITVLGKPQSIVAFVKQYLESHPHHRKPTPGRGGDARRGASLSGAGAGGPATVEQARARYEAERSPEAINELFNASRSKAS